MLDQYSVSGAGGAHFATARLFSGFLKPAVTTLARSCRSISATPSARLSAATAARISPSLWEPSSLTNLANLSVSSLRSTVQCCMVREVIVFGSFGGDYGRQPGSELR